MKIPKKTSGDPKILGINCLAGSFSMSSLAQRLAGLRRQKCRVVPSPEESRGSLKNDGANLATSMNL